METQLLKEGDKNLSQKKITLKKGREKLAKNHNPWIFSGAIQDIGGNVNDGDLVLVESSDRDFLAWGHYNSKSGIALRLLEWNKNIIPDFNWVKEKIFYACDMRKHLKNKFNTIYRIIFSESDMLPGIICDVFENVGVLQISTPGFDKMKYEIASIIKEAANLESVYEKSDGDGRRIEGLTESTGVLVGNLNSTKFVAVENSIKYEINLLSQKTGFFTDQRNNRELFGRYAYGEMLDMCAFSGAFSINALKKGVKHSTLCDISKESKELIDKNMSLNEIDSEKYSFIQGDAFDLLRNMKNESIKYDSIVLDPPKLAPSSKYLEKGLKAYKDINFNALKLIKENGIMATFSCSGAVSMEKFREAVAFAAKDSEKELKIIHQLHQGEDHPIRVSAPETEYLKGLLIRA